MNRTMNARLHTRSRLTDRYPGHAPVLVDLGLEAPIEADGRKHSAEERRRVPWRWLCGTVLTGFAGAVLIGAAIYVALGSQTNFAEPPQAALAPHREAGGETVNPRKSDRLVKSVDIVAARQTFRAPTTVSVGEKEFVRVRGFTRVATSLLITPSGFADEIPAFDPLKLLSDNRNPLAEPPEAGPVQDDAEVSFSTRDIDPQAAQDSGVSLSIEEIQAQIDEHLKNALAVGARSTLPLSSQIVLMRTSRATLDPTGGLGYAPLNGGIINAPFSSIEVRMVPENVTDIPRTTAGGGKGPEQRLVVARHGESLEDILRTQGVARDQIQLIVAAFGSKRGAALVNEGQRLKFLTLDNAGGGAQTQIARLSIYTDDKLETTVALADNGSFVRAEGAPPAAAPARAKPRSSEDDEDDEDSGGMRLYDSLYETALKNDLPRPMISDLVRVFANDVDFQRAVAAGDSFEAFYTEPEESDGRNELLYASITTRNETFKYYRFQTPDDNQVDYYDETGRSTRKFLVRQPIAAARITSGFGGRFHPILGYTRMHTGVDFAAPMGTPIFAAGNGTIIKAGRESGYGNRVEIQHANGYITTYNHMSGFARGVAEGARIKQGQLVGFLGMTGLATGPHLHYEVIVNGHFVDPMRVKLARTRELDGRMILGFRKERERIDGLIAKTPGVTRVAASQSVVR